MTHYRYNLLHFLWHFDHAKKSPLKLSMFHMIKLSSFEQNSMMNYLDARVEVVH